MIRRLEDLSTYNPRQDLFRFQKYFYILKMQIVRAKERLEMEMKTNKEKASSEDTTHQ